MAFKYMPNGTTVVMIEIRPLGSTKESDWIQIPQPSSMQLIYEDYDSDQSGRTLNLKMVRDYLGTKVKIEMEWSYITLTEVSPMLKIVRAPSFEVRYYDAYEGKDVKIEMYSGNKTLPYYNTIRDNDGNPVVGFESLSMNFIER